MASHRASAPWRPEKAAAAALAMAPAVWLAWLAYDGELGVRPVTEAIRFSGDWALRLLWLVLFIGPARRILGAPRLIRARRILGVGVFGLSALHFGLYALDQQFDWVQVARETVLRIYLTIGATALIGLAALAATSSDRAVARLGSARWNLLHRAIYAARGAVGGAFPAALQDRHVRADADVRPPGLADGIPPPPRADRRRHAARGWSASPRHAAS